MKKLKFVFWFLIKCSLLPIMLISCSKAIDTEAVNKSRAEKIISALYEYEQAHASFPYQLSDLVPEYLDSIHTTVGGEGFFYSIDSVNGFNLSLIIKSHYGCGYTGQSQQWECSYGD